MQFILLGEKTKKTPKKTQKTKPTIHTHLLRKTGANKGENYGIK